MKGVDARYALWGAGLAALPALAGYAHRSSRADLKVGAEARFHGFYFECHRHPAAAFTRHGPVSGCVACHQQPGTQLQDIMQ